VGATVTGAGGRVVRPGVDPGSAGGAAPVGVAPLAGLFARHPRGWDRPWHQWNRRAQPGYQPPDTGDAIAHRIEYDSWQPAPGSSK
jgi:hypothetical protein